MATGGSLSGDGHGGRTAVYHRNRSSSSGGGGGGHGGGDGGSAELYAHARNGLYNPHSDGGRYASARSPERAPSASGGASQSVGGDAGSAPRSVNALGLPRVSADMEQDRKLHGAVHAPSSHSFSSSQQQQHQYALGAARHPGEYERPAPHTARGGSGGGGGEGQTLSGAPSRPQPVYDASRNSAGESSGSAPRRATSPFRGSRSDPAVGRLSLHDAEWSAAAQRPPAAPNEAFAVSTPRLGSMESIGAAAAHLDSWRPPLTSGDEFIAFDGAQVAKLERLARALRALAPENDESCTILASELCGTLDAHGVRVTSLQVIHGVLRACEHVRTED